MSAEPTPIRRADVFDAIDSLAEGLAEEMFSVGDVTRIDPVSMPRSFQRLLVHTNHMTPTLKDYHGEAVDLRVLAHRDNERWYRRKIVLTVGDGGHAVEFGLVRLDLAALPEAVRRAVTKRESPLGDILIAHDVMTEVEPLWFLRFGAAHPVAAHLARSPGGAYFGRLATIHCDGQPAMELLEVVTDARL